jgi:poly [ADP-ribose] polymerase
MATIVKKVYLVKSDPVNNNNKFWRGTLFDNSDVLCEWGRVGDTGQSKLFSGAGESFLDKKVRKKKTDGRNEEIAYREVEVVDGVGTPTTIKASGNIAVIAQKQIQHSDPIASELIAYLSKVNIHNIGLASGGRITFNAQKGACETPLGLIGLNSINEARDILLRIGDLVLKRDYGNSLMEDTRSYLMKVPTDIGHKRLLLEEFWRDTSCVQKQNDLLDALQASLVQATSSSPSAKTDVNIPKIFDCKMAVITDKKLIKILFDDYYGHRSTMHTCHHLKPKVAWEIDIGAMKNDFIKDGSTMQNIVEGYHSSNAANILSILKSGLRIPPKSAPHVCGRLLGDGAYMAPFGIKGSPTKSLGYGYGYWGGISQKRFFMFVGDFALGKYYTPTSSNYQSISYPVKGYDSTWAKGGYSGVRNDECVVYRTSQANLKYLIEFE